MTSRSTLSWLLVATLLGLGWASSLEDQLYRSARAPAEESVEQKSHGHPGPGRRDSWKKLAWDMASYLDIFSSSSAALEKSLRKLSEKVHRELDLGHRENYSLIYAKQLLNEQRAVIDALRAGVSIPETAPVVADTTKKVPSYDEIIQKTEQFVRPMQDNGGAAGKDQVTEALSNEHDKLIQALQSLQNLKV